MGVPLSDPGAGAPGAGDMFLSVKGAKSRADQRRGAGRASTRTRSRCWPGRGACRDEPSLGGGVATGKATIRELRITKRVDKVVDRADVGVAPQRVDQGSDADGAQGRQDAARVPDDQDRERPGDRRSTLEAGRRSRDSPALFERVDLLVQQDHRRVHAAGRRRQPAGQHQLRGRVDDHRASR